MHIIVMGSGGVGGYFGAKLVRAGHTVTFVARGRHLDAMQRRGLRIRSAVDGDWRVDCQASDAVPGDRPADLILFCVKSQDTEHCAELIAPAVGPNTLVLSLQNGVDNETRLRKALPDCHLLGGVAYIFANIVEPGVIAHHQLGSIVLGDIDGGISSSTTELASTLISAGIDCRADKDINSVLWQKYVFLVAVAGTTAASRRPVGVIRDTPATRQVWQRQLDELLLLAHTEKIAMPSDMDSRCRNLLESLAEENYSSLYHDLVNGKTLELESLHGYAVRLGDCNGIATPTLSAIYGILKSQEPSLDA